jgi:hypothetical protein
MGELKTIPALDANDIELISECKRLYKEAKKELRKMPRNGSRMNQYRDRHEDLRKTVEQYSVSSLAEKFEVSRYKIERI